MKIEINTILKTVVILEPVEWKDVKEFMKDFSDYKLVCRTNEWYTYPTFPTYKYSDRGVITTASCDGNCGTGCTCVKPGELITYSSSRGIKAITDNSNLTFTSTI